MNNQIKIFLIVISSIWLASCGFKKLEQNKTKINIINVSESGNTRIGNLIRNNIFLISNKNAEHKYEINLKTQMTKESRIKDSKGKTTRYNMTITTSIKLMNIISKEPYSKSFSRNEDFYVANSHADTISNEKSALKNITQLLSEDIKNFIILSAKNL